MVVLIEPPLISSPAPAPVGIAGIAGLGAIGMASGAATAAGVRAVRALAERAGARGYAATLSVVAILLLDLGPNGAWRCQRGAAVG